MSSTGTSGTTQCSRRRRTKFNAMVRLDRECRRLVADSRTRSVGGDPQRALPFEVTEMLDPIFPFENDPKWRKVELIAGILAAAAIVLLCIWGSK